MECKLRKLQLHKWLVIDFNTGVARGRTYRRCWNCGRFEIGGADMWSNWAGPFDLKYLTEEESRIITSILTQLASIKPNYVEVKFLPEEQK